MNIGKFFALPIPLCCERYPLIQWLLWPPFYGPQNCIILLEPDPHWPMEATSRAFQHRRYALLALRAPPNTAALQTKEDSESHPSPSPPTTYSRPGPRETPQLTAA